MSAGLARSIASTMSRTYARAGGVYVDNYGTVGNGIADDTAAITAAIAATPAGGTLIFGPKTYLHTGLDFTQSGITLLGAGRGRTVLQLAAGVTRSSVALNPSGTSFKNPFAVEGIDILGVTGSSHGLWIRYASIVHLQDVRIYTHGGDGVRLYEVTSLQATNCESKNNTGNGWTLGKKSDAASFVTCSTQGNGGWGAVIGSDTGEEAGGNGRVNGVSWVGGTFLQNTSGGVQVRFAGTNGVSFTGVYFENNGTGQNAQIGENAGSTVGPVVFTSCYFNGANNVPIAIKVYNTNFVTVEHCFFENHATGALKLNVASTPWNWICSVSGSGYAVQDSASVNLSTATANVLSVMSTIKLGQADRTGTAELTVDRNNTDGNNAIRVVQSGAGAANAALLAVQADGTSTTQRAAFFRSKGTGSIAIFNDGTNNVLDVATSNRLGFYNTAAAAKQTVTGSRGGNAALASLLTALATIGLITDSSTV